jgi:hypothetical protein
MSRCLNTSLAISENILLISLNDSVAADESPAEIEGIMTDDLETKVYDDNGVPA